MVLDPVCGMTLDPSTAAASVEFEGARVYFCSDACRRRFSADPGAYSPARSPAPRAGQHACTVVGGHSSMSLNPATLAACSVTGLLATAALLGFYFGVVTLVSGWSFTLQQFAEFWLYIAALAVGFGIQVGFFVYLRRAARGETSGKVVAATGTTSGAAMVSCCTHYIVNLLPVVGATGIASLVGEYQIELFWLGLAANLAGIAFVGRRVVLFAHGG